MHNDIIMTDTEIIGYSWDIYARLSFELEKGRIEDAEEYNITDLLETLLQDHDGLVICRWHPQGAWYVADLIEA